MHHTCAYRAASAADATDTDLTALADQIMTIQNGHFLPQDDLQLIYAWAGAASMSRARLVTPKTRQITTPFLRPVNTALLPSTITPVADYRKQPFVCRRLEEIQVNGLQASGGAVPIIAVIGLLWQNIAPIVGDTYTLRGTGTATLTANAWSPVPITWQDILPTGRYACVGGNFISAGCVAGRFTFYNQYPRPGAIGTQTESAFPHPMFRMGELGVWGYFDTTTMPLVEFLATTADTAETVYMDLIKIG